MTERLGADVDSAFAAMRSFGRRRGLHLTRAGTAMTDGTVRVAVGWQARAFVGMNNGRAGTEWPRTHGECPLLAGAALDPGGTRD